MEIDLARQALRAAFRSAGELQELLQLCKGRLDPEEYQDFAHGIAEAIAAITFAVTNKALASHPELRAEIEADLAAFGRVR